MLRIRRKPECRKREREGLSAFEGIKGEKEGFGGITYEKEKSNAVRNTPRYTQTPVGSGDTIAENAARKTQREANSESSL